MMCAVPKCGGQACTIVCGFALCDPHYESFLTGYSQARSHNYIDHWWWWTTFGKEDVQKEKRENG